MWEAVGSAGNTSGDPVDVDALPLDGNIATTTDAARTAEPLDDADQDRSAVYAPDAVSKRVVADVGGER